MKKLTAIVLMIAVLITSAAFTACSGNSAEKKEAEAVSSAKAPDNQSVTEEVTYEALKTVEQLKKYPLNVEIFNKRFTGGKNFTGSATGIKADGEMKRIKDDSVTFKRVLPGYVYCEIQSSDNAVMLVYVPAEFSLSGELYNKDGSAVGKASYDTIYGLIRLGNIKGAYDIYSNGDIGWVNNKRFVEVFCTSESDFGDALVENHKNSSDKYDYIKVDFN